MSRKIDLREDSDCNGESPNTASVPSLSRKRPRHEDVGSEDTQVEDHREPRDDTVAAVSHSMKADSEKKRVVTVASKAANLNSRLFQHQKQPRALYFSTKAGDPAAETASATVKAASDATAAATSAASTATTKAKGFSFLAWYEGHLNARPWLRIDYNLNNVA
jgi:hypothetical protein